VKGEREREILIASSQIVHSIRLQLWFKLLDNSNHQQSSVIHSNTARFNIKRGIGIEKWG